MTRVLMTGVRGKTGVPLAELLVRRPDVDVLGGSSSPTAVTMDGVLPTAFSWDHPAGWAAATAGVDAMYVVRPDRADAPELIGALVAETPPRTRVVLLSEQDADQVGPDGWAMRAERAVRDSGRDWTILRPSWFMQVFTDARFYLDTIADGGELAFASGGKSVAWIDARDIAAVAERALLDEGHTGQTYEITGPEALSLPRTAELISQTAGHPVAHHEISIDEAAAGTEGFERELTALTFERVRAGSFAVVTDTVGRVTGEQPRTLQSFLLEAESTFRRVGSGGGVTQTMSDVVDTISLPMEPQRVALAPDGSHAYVTMTEIGSDVGAVAVIDTATREVVATVPVGSMPAEVVVSPDGESLYVPCWDGQGILSAIDLSTNTVTASVVLSGLGGGPTGAAITPDGAHVYVSTQHEVDGPEDRGKVSVVDTATLTISATIPINPFPSGMGITPDGRLVYALDSEGDPAVIDTSTNEATFPFLSSPVGDRVAFTPDGTLAYMVKDAETMIIGIEVATNRLITILDTDNGLATDVAITPDGHLVHVTDRTRHLISVVEAGVVDQPATHPTRWSGSANGIAIMPDGRTAYVADRASRAVQVIPVGDGDA